MKKLHSKKIDYDKFYTKKSVVELCIDIIDFSIYDFVIEPSAGSGNFLYKIPHENKIGIDIKPESRDILEMSWFDYNIPKQYSKVLIIGNPPFGIRNKLSKQFIEHSLKFSNVYTIAFILPNVYNKHTMQRKIPKEYRIKTILKLPKDSFEINGELYHVPCDFFVFEKSKGIDLRFDTSLYQETKDWEYAKESDYDFYIMGASFDIKDKPENNNRGYYIKVKSNKDLERVRNNFKNMRELKMRGYIQGYSSVNGGAYWVTKPELIKFYKEYVDS